MAPPIEPPPNYSSFRSWVAIAGAFLALYCTVGFFNAFGVYQEYYGTTLLKAYSNSDISWIGSVAIFLLYIGSPIAGILVDKIGPTKLLIIGSIGELVAIFLSSLCSQYYQLFLSQAVLFGASASLILTPCIAVVSRRMPHRRGLALGIAVGGSSIGGIIWPIMLQQLLYARGVSFGWVQRAVGFTMLPLFAVACLTVVDVEKGQHKPPPLESETSEGSITAGNSDETTPEEKPRAEHPIKVMFKNFTFVLLCLGLALTYLGLFTPFFYVSTYAVSKGASSSTAFYLISAINAASFFGRVVPGQLADRYGHFNICTLSVLTSGIIAFTWTAAYNLPGMIIWSIAYGFTSGAVISLQSACAGKISKPEQQGTALGLVLGTVSVTQVSSIASYRSSPANQGNRSLVGTPISGQILSRGGYLGLGIWTGVTLLTGGLVLVLARLKLDRKILAVY
ncbi:putative MFS monocarboxylate transporter [Xylaria grammica]|nr:putative MFS monocarboxylate transporter [Xylaria grammica]